MTEILKNALKEHKMSQKELAERCHVSPQAVSKWMTGEARPSVDSAMLIQEILGINLPYEVVKGSRKSKQTINIKHPNLEDLDSIEKAEKEAEQILENGQIATNYSHPVFILLKWLLTATIGLTYHESLEPKEEDESSDYRDIFYNLDNYLDPKPGLFKTELGYQFYLMGGDLFESACDWKNRDHDFVSAAMDYWYRFERATTAELESPFEGELKVAISELVHLYLFA